VRLAATAAGAGRAPAAVAFLYGLVLVAVRRSAARYAGPKLWVEPSPPMAHGILAADP
jgi:hypothetical protein